MFQQSKAVFDLYKYIYSLILCSTSAPVYAWNNVLNINRCINFNISEAAVRLYVRDAVKKNIILRTLANRFFFLFLWFSTDYFPSPWLWIPTPDPCGVLIFHELVINKIYSTVARRRLVQYIHAYARRHHYCQYQSARAVIYEQHNTQSYMITVCESKNFYFLNDP